MAMRCGECRTAVDDDAETCPRCGAPKTRFRAAEPGHAIESGGAQDMLSAPASGSGTRRPLGAYPRAAIGITVIAVIFMAVAYYSKHSHLENVRRKCIATFDLANRCDCIINQISKNTYAISFVPMFRIVSGLSQQKLGDIIREAAMTCVEPR
jgi:hypothetical protein